MDLRTIDSVRVRQSSGNFGLASTSHWAGRTRTERRYRSWQGDRASRPYTVALRVSLSRFGSQGTLAPSDLPAKEDIRLHEITRLTIWYAFPAGRHHTGYIALERNRDTLLTIVSGSETSITRGGRRQRGGRCCFVKSTTTMGRFFRRKRDEQRRHIFSLLRCEE